jgi:hypothetical protein
MHSATTNAWEKGNVQFFFRRILAAHTQRVM